MTEPRHLVPETAAATAQPRGRFPFAFGPRFFILLLVVAYLFFKRTEATMADII